ncbi:MAG: hypothetical protein KKD44_20025 [Proteobacteria bacterium]|nr:hypothetical protein [Pseudomonadota bacterium]
MKDDRFRRLCLAFICVMALFFSFASCGGSDSSEDGIGNNVIVNGQALSQQEIDEIVQFFGVEPAPGNYWYDSTSGLAGNVGQLATAFLPPGLPFAPIHQDASRGNTGVLVNGREITRDEVNFLKQIFSIEEVPQGNYTLLSNGDIFPTDDPYNPDSRGNIPDAMSYSGYSDNFWSSRYGVGNSAGGCSYISMPSATGGTSTTVTTGCG